MTAAVTETFPSAIDNSILSNFKACDQKGVYGFFENLAPVGTSVHLHAGGAFAHGIEAVRRAYYVRGLGAEESIAHGVVELLLYYGDFEAPSDSPKSAIRMAGALEFYFEQYPLATDFIQPWTDGSNIGIEFNFAIPLPLNNPETGAPLIYCGRFDMLGVLNGDGMFVVDEKTASSLGAQWSKQWELDSQFTGYVWGAQQYNMPVIGAMIRGISILKTKYDKAQAIIYRPQWMIDRWYEQMIAKVEHMIRLWKREALPELKLDKASCGAYGGCSYLSLCTSPSPERWKAINFEPRTWHPMLRDEREKELEAIRQQAETPSGKETRIQML